MSFTRVLIANRGEIARRIQRACAKLALESVAVFSEADSDAPFVIEADHAICIGPAAAADSYLNVDAILRAAKDSGAGAIHPGYGFLSENAGFARAVEQAGLVFVGPAPDAIAAMGSKIEAKAAAEAAGVPTLPDYRGADQSDARLLAEAEKLGTPFLVKASAGGGGRGMRLVTDMAGAGEAIRAARAEAVSAFGDPAVFLERYLPNARHVEVQVLGDRHGNHLHLWERDCSIQRNHQKLIEEAPAPDLPRAVRRAMLDAAIGMARAIDYHSAGTVEYLYDPARQEFYFLEMNTRLQVEHPVTEAITGLDLVQWQLRIAQGARLDIAQDDIPCDGHAIEVRLAAEDPAHGFLPETGRITLWQPPCGPGLRLDSGVEQGSMVSHHYDSMLAKLIAHGANRAEAIRRCLAALDRLAIGGIGLNAAYQRALLTHPDFTAVRHNTGGLAAMFPGGWCAPEASAETRALAALALHLHLSAPAADSPWQRLGGWRLTAPAGRAGAAHYWTLDADDPQEICVAGQGPDFELSAAGEAALAVTNASFRPGRLTFLRDGKPQRLTAHVERAPDGWRVHLGGPDGAFRVALLLLEDRHLATDGAGGADEDVLTAPMPGAVTELRVAPGDRVEKGDTLVVLEAMKLMQNLAASASGTVAEVFCTPGDTVAGGARLIRIERKDTT